MEVYSQRVEKAELWPAPLEEIWQKLPPGSGVGLAKKLPHLSLPELLLIAAVVTIPRPWRPWGIITWLGEVFGLSRVSIYKLGQRVVERLASPPPGRLLEPLVEAESEAGLIRVTATRLNRTILRGAFPGSLSIRDTQELLQTAFDQSRSIGSISQLLVSSGQKAGEVLNQVDTSPLGAVIALRDETFFQGWPILLLVEPVSSAIILARVSEDRQAETWATALLVAQERGLRIAGLVEDMARMYEKSLSLAEFEGQVQKDPWHLQQLARQLKLKLERQAYAAIAKEDKLTRQLLANWSDQLFLQTYIPAVEQMEQALDHLTALETNLEHLYDALELVDWRSGEIREPLSSSWLLDQTIAQLAQIDQPQVQSFVKTLRRHRPHLLTFLDWLGVALQPYQAQLAQALPDPQAQQAFSRTIARAWRLQQALDNAQRHFKPEAHQAQARCQALCGDDPTRQALAQQLYCLLDTAIHTSGLIECLNGWLKAFLKDRRAFKNIETAQAYLNLFTLWHNTRVYQRGHRAGHSPYQLAGIELGCDDWLALLGFPAD